VRVYLDACVLNRLTDLASSERVAQEKDACIELFRLIREGVVEWSASTALHFELQNNPHDERRSDALELLGYASELIEPEDDTTARAFALHAAGYGEFDALHIAFAEQAGAEILLTTDDRLLRRAMRNAANLRVEVMNPVEWLRRIGIWLPQSN